MLERLDNESSLAGIWAIAVEHFREFGLFHVSYVFFGGPDGRLEDILMLSTTPQEWVDAYSDNMGQPNSQLYNAFYDHCCNTYDGTKTGLAYIDEYKHYTNEERNLIKAIAQTGFTAGASFVMRKKSSDSSFGGWNLGGSFSKQEFDDLLAAEHESLRIVCMYFHERLQNFRSEDVAAMRSYDRGILSARQAQCLQLLAEGKRSKQIAHIMGVSLVTVEHHLRLARDKLGALTREQALAKAIALGLVSPARKHMVKTR